MATPPKDPSDNNNQDKNYNPGEQAYREGMGAGITSGKDIPDSEAGDSKDIKDAEEDGSWDNKVSPYAGNASRSGKGISRENFQAVLKKRGPLAAILTLLLGGGVGAGFFFGPSLLLVQIQESFLTKFDSQNTSLTIRTNRLLANKLTEDATQGSCNVVKIACRFSRPSNKLIKNLEANGVTAYDKNGDIIKRDGLFQSQRPAKYSFRGQDILAKDFSKTLRTNAQFRSAFHSAYNPRFVGFTDKVFRSIQTRFGFDTTNKTAVEGEQKTGERLNESSKGVNAAAAEATELAEEGTEGVIRKLVSDKAADVVSKIAKGGKGDAFGLAAAGVCVVADVPRLIISTVRTYQIVQVVNYSMQFLIAGSALKAGEITEEQAIALGALLTTAVANKSAMDSFGMKYAMFGDTSSPTSSWKKFVPGASATSSLGSIAQVLSSDAKKSMCDVATNPATGAAINIGLAAAGPETLGTSLLVAGINIAAGFVISEVVAQVGVPLIAEALKGIDVEPLLGFFLGDLTQNLAGEDVGNAIVSGASNVMGQTANAGGNMPLSVEQAIAYHQTTQEVRLAYAEEDRATHSPLDPTNPNTMVGSIVGKIVPYLASINSASGAFSSLAALSSQSFASILGSSSATAATAEQYSLCEDPAVTQDGVAAGPFCNIEYGIPPEYLDMDPQKIVDDLVVSGDVDQDTGDPIEKDDAGSLSQWISICTDGGTEQLKNCRIVDEKTAKYSLYIIDHRIQESMDEDDSIPTETTVEEPVTVDFNTKDVIATLPVVYEKKIVTTSVSKPLSSQFSISTPVVVSQNKSLLHTGWYWMVA